MMEHGKELPPITLSNTTISYLVTLVPLLVSMSSRREIPSYEDETDKPAWWPEDVQWRNPKFYMQDSSKKDDGLKVLRKLVHSCYSYHGVEDLLIRLEESPVSDSDMEPLESGDIIQLTDDYEDGLEESSAESEGPVFVCCFCLDQFGSHEEVSTHQNICLKRFKDARKGKGDHSAFEGAVENLQPEPSNEPQSIKDIFIQSIYGPVNESSSPFTNNSCDFLEDPSTTLLSASLRASSAISKFDDTFLTQAYSTSNSTTAVSQALTASAPSHQPTVAPSAKRQSSYTPYPFVPILKTRNQKKLDHIMEKHNLRKLMLQECSEMKDVPESGAWWVQQKQPTSNVVMFQHPETYLSQEAFISTLGLAKKADIEAMNNKAQKIEQEVDLDCEIISVEGPLSAVPPPPVFRSSSLSPHATRSLMSQLSRDIEGTTRRRISFCFVADEWADKEALEEGRDPLQTSLLTLDFSSPLGIRVKKYAKGEGHLNIIKDAECYCRTEMDEDSYSKLRFRGNDFRVTYRKKKRATNYVHKYKFNKQDRLEFKCLLKTGLSSRSRRLRQCLPTCSISLKRMTDQEIKLWTEEKKITITEKVIYDDDICITQIEIPESQVNQARSLDIVKAHSPMHSHQSLYKSHHRPGPLSHYLGRASSSTVNRKSLTPHVSSSPPHVPNIFRSRPPHTPSPPRTNFISHRSSHSRQNIPHSSMDKVRRDNSGQEPSQSSYSSNIKTTPSLQHKSLSKQNHSVSGRNLAAPSSFNCGHIGNDMHSGSNGVDKQAVGQYNSGSRRKQLMTVVREDDGDKSPSGLSSATSASNCKMGQHSTPIPSNLSQHTERMKTSNTARVNTSAGLMAACPMRKLSNFDYFSIRDGKILSDTPPYREHSVIYPHSRYGSAKVLAPSYKHQSCDNHIGHRPAPSQSSVSSSINSQQQHTPHHNNSSALTSNWTQPHSVIHHRPSQSQRSQQCATQRVGSDYSSASRHPAVIEKKSGIPAHSLMEHLQNTVSLPGVPQAKVPFLHHNPSAHIFEDDDILEVICIDDD